MGQFNSLSGKDETEKKNMAYKYHAVSAPQLIHKLLLEITLKKDRQSTLPVHNGHDIPHNLIITSHTGEKACAGHPAELIERESVHSQGAGAEDCLAATR